MYLSTSINQNPSCVGKGRDSLILTLATNHHQRCQQGLSRNSRACSGESKTVERCRRRTLASVSERGRYITPLRAWCMLYGHKATPAKFQWTCETSVDLRLVAGSVLELRRQILAISGGPLIRTLNRARLSSILPLPTQGHAPPEPQPTSLHAAMGHGFEKAVNVDS